MEVNSYYIGQGGGWLRVMDARMTTMLLMLGAMNSNKVESIVEKKQNWYANFKGPFEGTE